MISKRKAYELFERSLRNSAIGFCLSVRYLHYSYNPLLNHVEVTTALHCTLNVMNMDLALPRSQNLMLYIAEWQETGEQRVGEDLEGSGLN
jgi:hypothetical protein